MGEEFDYYFVTITVRYKKKEHSCSTVQGEK